METEIHDDLKWHKLSLRRSEVEISDVFAAFQDHGIEPILIKGWAAARNYPPDKTRFFGDIDVAVRDADFDAASRLIKSEDFPIAAIDLHREFRHLDKVAWETLFERSQMIAIDGVSVRLLCPEDHLRIMAVHWLNDGGAYKERLWDIYWAIKNRPEDFDWNVALDSAGPNRRNWIITTIMLAHRHLHLDISDIPIRDNEREIPGWVEKTLETEWSSDVRLMPLHTCIRDPRILFQQIRKRFPPNPIQATVETEGSFDESSRFPTQVKDIFYRASPSIARISSLLFGKSNK